MCLPVTVSISTRNILKEYFAKHRDMHNQSLRDLENLHVPEGYSPMALTTVKNKGAKIWNEIPFEISMRLQVLKELSNNISYHYTLNLAIHE